VISTYFCCHGTLLGSITPLNMSGFVCGSFGAPPASSFGTVGSTGPPTAGFQHQQAPLFGANGSAFPAGGFSSMPNANAATNAPNAFGAAVGAQDAYPQQQQFRQSMMFGSSSNIAAPAGLVGSSDGFGGFGTATTTMPNTPVSNSSTVGNPFNNSSHFSANPPSRIQQPFTPFGTGTSASIIQSSLVVPTPQIFGASSMVQPTSFVAASTTTTSSPFGFQQQPTSNSSSVAFGMSANFGTAAASQASFPQSLNGPFGASSNGFQTNHHAPFGNQPSTLTSSLPPSFGTSFALPSTTPMADGMSDDDGPIVSSALPFGQPVPMFSAADSKKSQRELAALVAKIAEKKKKIREKKHRKSLHATQTTTSTAALQADASPLNPSSSTLAQLDPSIAQLNALRFAESNDSATRSQLPSDLLLLSADVIAAQTALWNSGGQGDRENLESAVALAGTCEYMCPDEELVRREREGDVQLLERPDKQLHPSSWTLRNTMVKRFRRSAADYKLDGPEWIRPPDVLERVCGYLEEWVMVRFFSCPCCLCFPLHVQKSFVSSQYTLSM
jgi:SAC3/GANP family